MTNNETIELAELAEPLLVGRAQPLLNSRQNSPRESGPVVSRQPQAEVGPETPGAASDGKTNNFRVSVIDANDEVISELKISGPAASKVTLEDLRGFLGLFAGLGYLPIKCREELRAEEAQQGYVRPQMIVYEYGLREIFRDTMFDKLPGGVQQQIAGFAGFPNLQDLMDNPVYNMWGISLLLSSANSLPLNPREFKISRPPTLCGVPLEELNKVPICGEKVRLCGWSSLCCLVSVTSSFCFLNNPLVLQMFGVPVSSCGPDLEFPVKFAAGLVHCCCTLIGSGAAEGTIKKPVVDTLSIECVSPTVE